MIKLNPDATFVADVTVKALGRDDGQVAQFTFRVLDNARLNRLLVVLGFGKKSRLRRLGAYLALAWQLRRLPNMVDVMEQFIADWSGFDLPYSRDALRQLLLAFPGVGLSIVAAYLQQREEARLKN